MVNLLKQIEARIAEIGIDPARDWEVDQHHQYSYDLEEAAAINELRWILALLKEEMAALK